MLTECKKERVGRQHTTSTSWQNDACSNELFSLTGRLCVGGKRFDWPNVTFCLLFYTERSWHAFKCKALHCGWLRGLDCLISPKWLLDLNRSNPFFSCPWSMSLFPAMFCHAGTSLLAFLGVIILTDSDLQIQISKKWIVASTEA